MFKIGDRVCYKSISGRVWKYAGVIEDIRQIRGEVEYLVKWDERSSPQWGYLHYNIELEEADIPETPKEPTDEELAQKYRDLVKEMTETRQALKSRGFELMFSQLPVPIMSEAQRSGMEFVKTEVTRL